MKDETMPSIVLVEDDPVLRCNFTDLLCSEGFSVESYSDRLSAMEHFKKTLPDIVLLDISLGHETDAGFQICQDLRKQSETVPIVFLTSHVSDFDKISGMRLGADDYLTKDINMDYLIVRIKALLKRRIKLKNSSNEPDSTIIERGDLNVDLGTLKLYWKSSLVELSLTQFWMVHSMASYPGHVRTHAQLMEAASITVEHNTIAAHIKNIRYRFNDIDAEFSSISVERGVGYRWVTK